MYVTLDVFKRLESEVLNLVSELSHSPILQDVQNVTVTPAQFLGIEIKPWAKEIAELVLWIGYLQWHFRTRGNVAPKEPVLHDFKNIERRDAVLAYDREEIALDEHPESAQEDLAAAILAEIEAEDRFDTALDGASESLDELADEALAEHRGGKTQPLDPQTR